MTNLPLFSIIVPVYNVQQYIHQCIDSVLSQNFKDYELILIDDGSTDNSSIICDKYSQKDLRIKVIHKENSGSSDARNSGLKNANGKYIIFLDSDDYWNRNDALTYLAEIINDNNADIIFLKETIYYERINKYLHPVLEFNREKIQHCSIEKVLKYLVESQQLTVFSWDKVIKRKLIVDNNIEFESGLRLEDVDWFPKVMLNAKTFDALNCIFYVYRKQRKNSVTFKVEFEDLKDIFSSIKKWITNIHSGDYSTDTRKYMLSFFALLYAVLLGLIPLIKNSSMHNFKNEYKNIQKDIKRYSWILNYDSDIKIKIVKIIYKLFGIKFVSFIMSKQSNYHYLYFYRYFSKLYLFFSSLIDKIDKLN